MALTRIIGAGTAGTAVMTLFSYAVSKAARKNFVEPVILGELLNRTLIPKKSNAKLAGWGTHLGIGLLFTAAYDGYLKLKATKPNLANTLILGVAGGSAGVAVWHGTFKAHPNPPGVDIKNFYRQLMIAHLVFAAGVAITYKLSNNKYSGTTAPDSN